VAFAARANSIHVVSGVYVWESAGDAKRLHRRREYSNRGAGSYRRFAPLRQHAEPEWPRIGAYPTVGSTNNVWKNDNVDGSFGITSPIFLDQITPSGTLVNTLLVPSSLLTTSFSSKSDLAANLSTDGTALTLVGYMAPPNTIDVSNSNTPGVYDPTNPAGGSYFRAVLQVGANGAMEITPTNAYSGNNGRAAILSNGVYYLAANDNNGSGTPNNITTSTGVEIATPGQSATTTPTQVRTFSVSQYNDPSTGKTLPRRQSWQRQ
jgi:hypothetical protein